MCHRCRNRANTSVTTDTTGPFKKKTVWKIGTDTCGCFQESDRSLWAFVKFCSSISCFTFYERKGLKDEESFPSYLRKCFSAGLVWLTLSCLHERLLHRNRCFGGDAKARTNQSRIIISDPAMTTGANEQTRCKHGDWASYVEMCEMHRLLATAAHRSQLQLCERIQPCRGPATGPC